MTQYAVRFEVTLCTSEAHSLQEAIQVLGQQLCRLDHVCSVEVENAWEEQVEDEDEDLTEVYPDPHP